MQVAAEAAPTRDQLEHWRKCGICGISPYTTNEGVLKCLYCFHRVCLPCLDKEGQVASFGEHETSCAVSKSAQQMRRGWAMAEIGCAAPSGLLPVQVIKNRGEPLLKTALAPKFRSPNTIFFPYKSGTIPAGTSVMWGVVLGSSLEVGPIYNIRRGVTTGVSTDKTAVVGENRICVEDLFLLTPQPLKQRNTSTQRMTRCSWRLRLIKRQSDEWEVTVFEPQHHGHPKPDPSRSLTHGELVTMPGVSESVEAMKGLKIPLRYAQRIVRAKLTVGEVSDQSMRSLMSQKADPSDEEILKLYQTPENGEFLFVAHPGKEQDAISCVFALNPISG